MQEKIERYERAIAVDTELLLKRLAEGDAEGAHALVEGIVFGRQQVEALRAQAQ